MWAPADGVLAQVAFPPIRTLDSSQTPRRVETASTPRALPPVDLPAIQAALTGMDAGAAEAQVAPTPDRRA